MLLGRNQLDDLGEGSMDSQQACLQDPWNSSQQQTYFPSTIIISDHSMAHVYFIAANQWRADCRGSSWRI